MADIDIIGSETTETIIKKSAGGKNLYIKITNGDNTGANKKYPGYYEFNAAAPKLSQIAGHEKEGNDPDSGVANFISAVFRSRNIEPQNAAYPCIKGGGNKIVEWPNGTVVKTGTGCFDAPVLTLMAMTDIEVRKFDGNVEVYGEIGRALTAGSVHKYLPEEIMGYLKFMTTSGHSSSADLDIKKITGDFTSDGISFGNFSPNTLASAPSDALARIMNCESAPNLSQTKNTQNLVLYKSEYKSDKMPSEIEGNLAIYFCDLAGIEKLPVVSGNLSIVGCSNFDWGKVFPELEVAGDLILGEQMVAEKDFPDEKGIKELVKCCEEVKIQKESEVEAIMGKEDNSEIVKAQEKASDYTKGILDTVNKNFGTVGVGVAKGIAKWFGKNVDYDPNDPYDRKKKNQEKEDIEAMQRVMSRMGGSNGNQTQQQNQATNQVNNQQTKK